MTKFLLICASLLTASGAYAQDAKTHRAPSSEEITIRTENYPRPPYSGATYYLYEEAGQVICTKLQVCNKFDDCEVSYHKGAFKDQEDIDTGAPYDSTPAQVIAAGSLHKHLCLTKFGIVKR